MLWHQLGTALTENQARLIKRYTKNVILSYDADNAGQNAAFRGLDILYQEGLKARVLRVTDGKDPDEFVKKNGKKFTELVKNAVPYGDFKISVIRDRYDMEDEQQRVDFIRDVIEILKKNETCRGRYIYQENCCGDGDFGRCYKI